MFWDFLRAHSLPVSTMSTVAYLCVRIVEQSTKAFFVYVMSTIRFNTAKKWNASDTKTDSGSDPFRLSTDVKQLIVHGKLQYSLVAYYHIKRISHANVMKMWFIISENTK